MDTSEPDAVPPRETPPARPALGWLGWLDVLFVTVGYLCAVGNVGFAVLSRARRGASGPASDLLVPTLCLASLLVTVGLVAWVAKHGRPAVRAAREVFVLVALVAWGFALNHWGTHASCVVGSCSASDTVFRPLAEPAAWGVAALHLCTTLAYAVSRRRPEALHPRLEALVCAGMLSGLALQATLTVHFLSMMPFVVLLPATFPLLAPLLALSHFAGELRERLYRRGAERAVEAAPSMEDAYRGAPVPELATKRIDGSLLLRSLGLTPLVLGAWGVLQSAWLHRPGAAFEALTATCAHTFSRLPVQTIPEDCHYLCTVAAGGHPWLVGPERLGVRGGVVIVVNRQLAVANAFEDLLHERWPRFGRLARRVYDRLGLPLSRYLRNRWLADLVYLAMKPAEWAFVLFLLLVDRRPPEQRIERMYRPAAPT